MVTVNTSTSIFGTKKLGETGSESEGSGLENIFASMLSLLEEERKSTGETEQTASSGGVVGLLEQIKKEINFSQINSTSIQSRTNLGDLNSSILKLYQTYKTEIDKVIQVANEATISFNLEKLINSKLIKSIGDPTNDTEISSLEKVSSSTMDKKLPSSSFSEFDQTIEEFSNLEMQRIKNSLKKHALTTTGENNNKNNSTAELKLNDPLTTNKEVSSSPSEHNRNNTPLFSPSVNQKSDIKPKSQGNETIKWDAANDQNQLPTKNTSVKTTNSEQTLQSNQNSNQTYLKLLEKNWGQELSKIIENTILSGKKKIEINLEPQRLGKMSLSLSVVNNQTSIFIGTESTSASLILTTSEDRLNQMFEAAGYKLTNFQANSNGKNNSNQNNTRPNPDKMADNKATDSTKEVTSEREDKYLLNSDGRKIINIIA